MLRPKIVRVQSRLPNVYIATLLLFLFGLLTALSCVPSNDAPPLEYRTQRLNETIMCPVCPGESIDQSQNMLAAQMRGVVNEKLSEGWSDEQIRDFFVERFGPSVLMEPPREGLGIVAWTLPAAVVIGAGAALLIALRSMTRGRRADLKEDAEGTLSDEELAHYTQLVRAAVEGVEGGQSPAEGNQDRHA